MAPLELARLRGAVRAGLFDAPAEPPRVGRYELLRCIGRGGMGIVYAARDVELGREVAIKLLRPELSGGAEDRRLTAEAQALARLAHPNVITVFDVGTFEGQRFIAMEYVPGQDLRRWLDAPRPLADVLRVFAGAGRGLHAAHAVGLVHRDFKPDNVLVGDDGRPRVLDFGLARPPDDPGAAARPPALPAVVDPRSTVLTADGQVVGTPAYMAPEQHLGEPADARSDQFSFGVSLYHAVYGVRPFTGDDPRSLALSIVRGRVRPATPRYPVPEWLDALLVRTLSVDPARRYASMEALLAVLEAKLAQEPGAPELRALPTRAVVEELDSSDADGIAVLDAIDAIGLSPTLHAPREPVVISVPSTPALPSEESHEGVVRSLSTRRTLPEVLDERTLEILTRELDRLGRRRGKVARLGTCLAWSTRELEVHVDVTPRGSEILVWRRLGPALRRRIARWMLLGTWLACLFIAVVIGSLEPIHGAAETLVPLIVIGSLVGGGVMGYRKAIGRHVRALPSARADVEFVADRLVGLSRANQRALGEG